MSVTEESQAAAGLTGHFSYVLKRPHVAFLDSVVSGGLSLLAFEPDVLFRSYGRRIEIHRADGGSQTFEADPFEVLGDLLESKKRCSTPGDPGIPNGAAIGYFGYDLKNLLEQLPARASEEIGLPDCWFGFYDNLFVFDHQTSKILAVGQPEAVPPSHNPASFLPHPFSWNPLSSTRPSAPRSNCTRAAYLAMVDRARDYIAAGDVYQVNLSQRFHAQTNATGPALYLALRQNNPAPFAAYLDLGAAQILSSSPESFLRLSGRHIQTRPIKGTRPRSHDKARDAIVARELLMSTKDQAELLMITDLLRNDLGKVCEYGTVAVPELVRLEEYATVLHLVSTVEGTLRDDVSHLEALRACFPGGSITGAPKIRAMEIIDELEPHARGVYTGAIGYFGYNGISQFNVAIRTMIKKGRDVYFHAGSGIVADSDPAAEYEETLAKAAGMMSALELVETASVASAVQERQGFACAAADATTIRP